MVLLMFAYRTHQRLSARTNIRFEPSLAGKSLGYEAEARLDGKSLMSGQRVPIGWHTLTVSHPKTKTFSTNLFVWYGQHDLGGIELERATGVLVVNASPAAHYLTIRGPEFSVTLTNSLGITSSVPTDRYVVEASYKYWQRKETVTVSSDQSVVQSFAPKLGALHIESSHADAEYQLRDGKNTRLDYGTLPATITGLPEASYQLVSTRKDDQRKLSVSVKAGETNEVRVEFAYGAALLESDPSGATVLHDGRELGITPLTLPELKPGTFAFSLRLIDYETVTDSLSIDVRQTNSFRATLVSRYYTQAMESARRLYDEKSFDRAAESATEALKYKADDTEAKRLQRDATGHAHLMRAEQSGKQGDYAEGIKEINESLSFLPDSIYAKTLLTDLTKREQERIEAEKKRQAEREEQARLKREAEQVIALRQKRLNALNNAFTAMNRSYENAMAFASHDLTTTNASGSVATLINNALKGGQPSFEIIRYEWPSAELFTIQARQRMGIGYREALIVGGKLGENETKILFKVLEFEQPATVNPLNGLLSATATVNITSQDPSVARERAEKYKQRILEGIKIVRERIQNAIGR